MISKLPEQDDQETYLDFRGVGSLDVRQRTVVELLLESLGEEHSELGVVDELQQSALLSLWFQTGLQGYQSQQQLVERRSRHR
jgi:hypothetical protein